MLIYFPFDWFPASSVRLTHSLRVMTNTLMTHEALAVSANPLTLEEGCVLISQHIREVQELSHRAVNEFGEVDFSIIDAHRKVLLDLAEPSDNLLGSDLQYGLIPEITVLYQDSPGKFRGYLENLVSLQETFDSCNESGNAIWQTLVELKRICQAALRVVPPSLFSA